MGTAGAAHKPRPLPDGSGLVTWAVILWVQRHGMAQELSARKLGSGARRAQLYADFTALQILSFTL